MTFRQKVDPSDLQPPLPLKATTFEGVDFHPQMEDWDVGGLVGSLRLTFSDFASLSREMVHRLKWGLLICLQNQSSSYASNKYYRFKSFYRSVLAQHDVVHHQVELPEVLSYRGRLEPNTEWYLGVIRVLLTDLEQLGFGIASTETVEYMSTATIRGSIKGTSIRTRDETSGSFTDAELLEMQSVLNDAYAAGRIDLTAFAITWLFLAYGSRPIQVAALKERDLIISTGSEERTYALRVPRAKQQGEKVRGSFKTRYCGKQVGVLLERVIHENGSRREEFDLSEHDSPMFISKSEGNLPGMHHHMTGWEIGRIVANTMERLTGLKANSRRFRITLAQRAVDDGKDKYTVAELLDHSDTQNVGVYFEASPAMVLRLDRHLAMELAPLAQAFAGVVVTTEQEARRGDDRTSRIFDRSLNNVRAALGTCGQMSFCGLAAPFACYTCRHFQPWIDGPHEEFMSALITDRDRLEAEGYSPKIYTIRDRTILAVAEVIQLCVAEKAIRAEVAA